MTFIFYIVFSLIDYYLEISNQLNFTVMLLLFTLSFIELINLKTYNEQQILIIVSKSIKLEEENYESITLYNFYKHIQRNKDSKKLLYMLL